MKILQKPLVAIVFSLFLIIISTSYLVLRYDPDQMTEPAIPFEEHAILDTWVWLTDIDYMLIFNPNGTGTWAGVADDFLWSPVDEDNVYIYVNNTRWWHAELSDADVVNLTSLMADGVSYQYVREALMFDINQDEIVEAIRLQMEILLDDYDGEITLVSTIQLTTSPPLSTFKPTDPIIYTTLGSENGLMQEPMIVKGEVSEWSNQNGWTMIHITNDDGELLVGFIEPLANNRISDYQRLLPVGTNVRIHYIYSGFSGVTETPMGMAIGFHVLDGESSTTQREVTPSGQPSSNELIGSWHEGEGRIFLFVLGQPDRLEFKENGELIVTEGYNNRTLRWEQISETEFLINNDAFTFNINNSTLRVVDRWDDEWLLTREN